MAELTKNIAVGLEDGLAPRQVAMLVQLASTFHTEDILIEYNGKSVNPKSLMSAMYLAAPEGDVFQVTVKGPDADKTIQAFEEFLTPEK